jgi:Ca2+-binding RTX toxin-like protein
MLAQLVSVLNGSERTPANISLPFLSGSLADAVKAAEGLVDFLKTNVTQPPTVPKDPVDPAKIGEPTFRSIQDLVKALDDYTGGTDFAGTTFTISVGSFANDRLPIDLTMHRTVASPIDLVKKTVAVGGAATSYSATGLTAAATFLPEIVGRRVIAGSSGGTIASISADKHTLTLSGSGWVGGTPEPTAPYSVSGPDVDAGTANLANLLGTGTGPTAKKIINANAIQPSAKITPDYTARLKFALDLSAPKTGAACVGTPTGVAGVLATTCPFTRTNLDGTKVVVTEVPLPVERLLVGTGYNLVTADAPLSAGVDVYAKAGFLKVKIGGTITLCRKDGTSADCTGTGTAPMLTITLNPIAGDPADGYVPIAELFGSLIGPGVTSRLSIDTNVRGYATGSVSVPDAAAFLPGGTAEFKLKLADATDLSTLTVEATDLSEILNFDIDPTDPQALLGIVLRALQLLDDQLREGDPTDTTSALGKKIPLIDMSLRDLLGSDEAGGGLTVTYANSTFDTDGAGGADPIDTTKLTDTSRTDGRVFPSSLVGRGVIVGTKVGVVLKVEDDGKSLQLMKLTQLPAKATPYFLRSELADAISLLTAAPPDSVQELVKILNARLGHTLPLAFEYKDLGGTPSLLLKLDWNRKFSKTAPIKFDLGGDTIAGTSGDGNAEITVTANAKVGVAVPLAIPTEAAGGLSAVALKVLDDSQLSIDATASVNGSVRANLGPLALALGKPGGTGAELAQAKAHYKLGLSKTGGTAATSSSLTSFLSGVALNINDYSGGVDCGDPAAVSPAVHDDLALCGSLPFYLSSNDGATWNKLQGASANDLALKVRLPRNNASGLFSLTGNVSGADARARLEAPTAADLSAAFSAALLNFGTIGDGLDAFLGVVEDALNAASQQGKLPIVGDDLQAGADFVGKLRTQLDALFVQIKGVNGGKLPDVAQINDYLDTKFKQALTAAGADASNFSLKITCKLKPSTVSAVTATVKPPPAPPVTDPPTPPTPTPTPKQYTYAVVAVGSFNGADIDTKISNEMSVNNEATLGTESFNTITWSGPSNAQKHKVLRKNGGTWDVLATVTGSTSYQDKGAAAASTGYTPPATEATVDVCTGVTIFEVQGVVLRVDIGKGVVDAGSGCTGADCISNEIPLNIGVPGLAVHPARDGEGGGLSTKIGWKIHLALTLDKTDGFSILTKDQGLPEIGVGINVDLDTALQAELAFLKIDISKNDSDDDPDTDEPPAFAGAFQVDLKSGTGETSCWTAPCANDPTKKLGLSELMGAKTFTDVVDAQLSLKLAVDWFMKATADAQLPGIQARLVIGWNQTITASTVSATQLAALHIGFEDVAIDAGDFLSKVLGPIVKQLKSVTGPVQPILDVLYAPIPVLSDLSEMAGGPPVTLVTLAKAFSTIAGGPDLKFVDTVAAVIKFVNDLPSGEGDNLIVPIGSFSVSSDQAWNVPATPDSADKLINQGSKKYKKKTSPTTYVDSTVEADSKPAVDIDSKSNKPSLATPVASGAGFKFPVLDHPSSLFNLLMGGDVDLVTFDSGPLTLGFTWRQSFGPVYAPPPVFITLSGSASVTARIVAGFDTYGLRKAFESGFNASGLAQILNGLYFKSTDDSGAPLPVVTFYGEIAAGAAVSAVIITVGIEGGVSLTINLAWNDPNGDGKFRLFEFGQVALNNPICLFQMSGRIALFLRVYITLGFSPFSVSFSFTLADITLLDFNVKPDCDPPPPRLGGVSGTTLVVFAGKLGTGAIRGHSAWDNTGADYGDDVVKVTELHSFTDSGTATKTGVKVEMLGITETWSDPNIDRVVVDGRFYGHNLKVSLIGDGDKTKTSKAAEVVPTGGFDLQAVVLGGNGDDVVKTGSGRSKVDGGAGKDTISLSDAANIGSDTWVAGGAGDDSITTGNNSAIAAGDSSLSSAADKGELELTLSDEKPGKKKLTGIVNWDALSAPGNGEDTTNDGSDRIAVGRGTNTVYGNAGDDAVGVAADSPVPGGPAAGANKIVLGRGSDTAKGGSNNDTIWTGLETGQARSDNATWDVDGAGGTDSTASRNSVDTGAGSDTVFGGTGNDFVTTGSTSAQTAVVTGGSGQDVLLGHFGTDELYGGPGKDWVVAEPAEVGDSTGEDGLGTLIRPFKHLPLPAGTSSSKKVLVGGDGEDRIIGGDGTANIFGDRYETDACGSPAGTPESTPPAEPSAGSPGRDLITGGAGIDTVKAGGEADKVTTFAGDDLVCGQAGDDELYAGDDADKVWGGTGADRAYGENGDDKVYGNAGADQLYGGNQNDVIEGNDGSDKAYGGSGDDTILGGTRHAGDLDQGDTLYGDTGNDTIIGDNGSDTYPLDLDGGSTTAGGADTIWAGPGTDNAYGGLDNDTINGGTEADHLEGNNAVDTVNGDEGEDEIIGGSSEEIGITGVGRPDAGDKLNGGTGNDLILGDNAKVAAQDWLLPGSTALVAGRGFLSGHSLAMLDLDLSGDHPLNSGSDTIHGDADNDVIVAGGKNDTVFGDANDDYIEGNGGIDTISGGVGLDDIVGGSSPSTGGSEPDDGDLIHGDGDGDVVLGDNGSILRTGTMSPVTKNRSGTERAIALLDTTAATAGHNGADTVHGDDGADIIFGQRSDDLLYGNAGDDYIEGDQDHDLIEGSSGQDDLVGGGSVTLSGATTDTAVGQSDTDDVIYGGANEDLVTGDNAELLRVETADAKFSPLTDRAGMTRRTVRLLDLNKSGTTFVATPAEISGGDQLSGGSADDVVLGQDGNDWITGGDNGDYAEGNGGDDRVYGDRLLHSDRSGRVTGAPDVPASLVGGLSSLDEREGAAGADGQDDLIGGSSNIAPTSTSMTGRDGFRDGGDTVLGDGEADYELGDNGTLLREGDGAGGYKRMVQRYPIPYTVPAGGDPRAMVRHALRLDIPAANTTALTAGTSGPDTMQGNAGEDFMWGQSGSDLMNGNDGNDDMYGELGDDTMFGDAGDDAMLGDRGGMTSRWLDGSPGDPTIAALTMNSPPKETLVGLRTGTLDRRVDQLHDNAANASNTGDVTAFATGLLPFSGIAKGGVDRMRGGLDHDSLHGEAGNDLMNGDSGGDVLFGDDGSDVMWGGRGCDPVVNAATADCKTAGVFDQSARGTNDRFVDYLMSGNGGLSTKGDGIPELMDFRPRGTYSTTPSATTCSGTELPITAPGKNGASVDPCSWFLMTDANLSDISLHQHHQGTDWMYGGWDRDVMEGDVAANGPNPGDRMIDWNGTVNLYNHCNAAYGGFNDVRQISPEMQDFVQKWAYVMGAGQTLTGPNGVLTSATSGFNELAMVYTSDLNANSGAAYPTTPGHFEDFSCAP